MRERRSAWVLAAAGLLVCTLLGACAAAEQRRLISDSRALGRAVARGDQEAVRDGVSPAARARVDLAALAEADQAQAWAAALRRPLAARPEALVALDGGPVAAVWTDEGWRFAEDPTEVYGQGTPRQALRALVRATHHGRWDVLLELAPLRYRVGLSAQDLEQAWTEGAYGEALRAARDRLEAGLDGPIFIDGPQAVLPLPGDPDGAGGGAARLEREGARWVVVDF